MTMPYDKIGKAVAMLEGTTDPEKLAAIAAMERLLNSSGKTFVDLGDAISRLQAPIIQPQQKPNDWRQTARWCAAYGVGVLNEREHEFVDDLARSKGFRTLSVRQESWLLSIMSKLSMRGAA